MDDDHVRTLMAVHAHPDDESISTGGILAKYAARGIRTIVVYCTRGEAGEILNHEFVPPSPGMDMQEIREIELRKAVETLQVGSVFFLEYRDSGMEGDPQNHHPQAFAQADIEEATGKLVNIIRQTRPHVLVTYNQRGTYGHPDHIMANRVTVRAFKAAADPAFRGGNGLPPWGPAKLYYTAIPLLRVRMMRQVAVERGEEFEFDPEVLGTPEERISSAIDIREFLARKFKAIFCHESQMGPNSFFRRIPEERKEAAFGWEYFECVHGCTSKRETDLFEGI